MEDKWDCYIKNELETIYSSPKHINRELISSYKNKEELRRFNLIFFIISILKSISVITIGIIFLSDIFLKLVIIGLGILLFNFSLSLFTLIIKEEGIFV